MKVIVTATGVKLGSKGLVANTAEKVGSLLGTMSKGEARRVRKELRKGGHNNLAGAVRRAA